MSGPCSNQIEERPFDGMTLFFVPHSRVGICPNGSQLSMWDDPVAYFTFLKDFIKDVEEGNPISDSSSSNIEANRS
jgi:hypothetical protein